MLAMHPSGKMLYSAIKDMVGDSTTLIGMYGDMFTLSDYTNIDILLAFDVHGTSLKLRQVNTTPGENGDSLVASPDGKFVSYVSGGGYRQGPGGAQYGYTIPAFAAANVQLATVSYNTDAYPMGCSFHPFLPLVAATNGHEVRIYDENTGRDAHRNFSCRNRWRSRMSTSLLLLHARWQASDDRRP